MAKKRATHQETNEVGDSPAAKQQQLGDWGDVVPEAVQDAVDEYVRLLRLKNKATEKVNSAKEECISRMKEHGVTKVRIDEGAKWLKCEDEPKLKTEKIKERRDD